jgi:hypothetical protein
MVLKMTLGNVRNAKEQEWYGEAYSLLLMDRLLKVGIRGVKEMTVDELVEVLKEGVAALKANKAFMTDEMFLKIQSLIERVKEMPDVLEKVLEFKPEQIKSIFELMDRFVAIERKLVKTPMGDNLIKSMTDLQNKPVILRMIAMLV